MTKTYTELIPALEKIKLEALESDIAREKQIADGEFERDSEEDQEFCASRAEEVCPGAREVYPEMVPSDGQEGPHRISCVIFRQLVKLRNAETGCRDQDDCEYCHLGLAVENKKIADCAPWSMDLHDLSELLDEIEGENMEMEKDCKNCLYIREHNSAPAEFDYTCARMEEIDFYSYDPHPEVKDPFSKLDTNQAECCPEFTPGGCKDCAHHPNDECQLHDSPTTPCEDYYYLDKNRPLLANGVSVVEDEAKEALKAEIERMKKKQIGGLTYNSNGTHAAGYKDLAFCHAKYFEIMGDRPWTTQLDLEDLRDDDATIMCLVGSFFYPENWCSACYVKWAQNKKLCAGCTADSDYGPGQLTVEDFEIILAAVEAKELDDAKADGITPRKKFLSSAYAYEKKISSRSAENFFCPPPTDEEKKQMVNALESELIRADIMGAYFAELSPGDLAFCSEEINSITGQKNQLFGPYGDVGHHDVIRSTQDYFILCETARILDTTDSQKDFDRLDTPEAVYDPCHFCYLRRAEKSGLLTSGCSELIKYPPDQRWADLKTTWDALDRGLI